MGGSSGNYKTGEGRAESENFMKGNIREIQKLMDLALVIIINLSVLLQRG